MQTIHLPARLLGELDLADLNLRLHKGEIDLDWSRVEPGGEPAHLHALLAGFNIRVMLT